VIQNSKSKKSKSSSAPTEFEKNIYGLCRLSDSRFVINPYFSRSNLYAQQLRVLALVKMIHFHGLLPAGERNIVVVGAGIAGLTAAAAAESIGAIVTLVDESSRLENPLQQFEGAVHREFHPTLIQWPHTGLVAATDLPFLNWACLPADRVVRNIRNQWFQHHSENIHTHAGKVLKIKECDETVKIEVDDGTALKADLVIIAAGWRGELKMEGLDTPSYWETRDYDSSLEVVISGAGDGGVIDAAQQFFGHRTTSAARALAYSLESSSINDDIKEVEALPNDRKMTNFYENLRLPDAQSEELDKCRRKDSPVVRLIHNNDSIYSGKIAPINKIMLSASMSNNNIGLTLCCGSLVAGPTHDAGAFIEHEGGGMEKILTPRIVIRHGARPSIEEFLDQEDVLTLKSYPLACYSNFVPNEVDWDFYKKSSGSRPRQGKLSWADSNEIRAMLAHICLDDPNYTLFVIRNGQWKVHAWGNALLRLKGVLPIQLKRLKIELVESQFEISI